MGTTEAYELLVVGVVLLAVVVLASLHFLRGYRLRRLQALREQGSAPTVASDRAFNRLALARREAEVLAAQGVDVDRARTLIGLAEQSLEARNFDRAYELAQAAHETLVKARKEPGRVASVASVPAPTLPRDLPPTALAAPRAAQESGSTSPSVAKNRAEAQFQLRLFEQDLAEASKARSDRVQVEGARELYVQAHAAFSRGDYAEAFRLALRGRRQVGGHVESLGPSSPSPPAPGSTTTPGDPSRSAEVAAAAERCPRCGHPTVPGDAFCRGCGAARDLPTCPKCGASRTPADTFCGRCGERYQ